MTEYNPTMRFTMGNQEFELNRRNASLFMFVGRSVIRGLMRENSDFNHVFVETEAVNDEVSSGLYIPKMIFPKAYAIMADFMGKNCFPAHVNLNEVAECDTDAIFNMLARQTEKELENIPDELPEGWE